jgi:hypothetical protein
MTTKVSSEAGCRCSGGPAVAAGTRQSMTDAAPALSSLDSRMSRPRPARLAASCWPGNTTVDMGETFLVR